MGLQRMIDGDNGDVVIHTYEDAQSVIDAAAAERRWNDEAGRFAKKADFRKKLSIPSNIMLKVCQENNLNWLDPHDAKKVLKIFAGVEWKHLRTVSDKRI